MERNEITRWFFMMKILFCISLILLFSIQSCLEESEHSHHIVKESPYNLNDTLLYQDTLPKNLNASDQKIPDNSEHHIVPYDINQFLMDPFDLLAFKRSTEAHSGGGANHSYFHKPSFRGFYCHFFMFSKLQGYIGHTKNKIITKEDGIQMVTYKPYGKFDTDYIDPNEKLIEVNATFNHPDLPEFALIGLDTAEINQILGLKKQVRGNCFFYTHKDRILILSLQNGRVIWLKYVHLTSPFDQLKDTTGLFSHHSR